MYTRFDPEARIAVMQAIDEARELGHSEVGPDHVLLGLLANVRGETYALLSSHGLQFDSARTIVIDRHRDAEPSPAQAADAERPDTSDLDEDREALRAIGIDLDKVREAVRSTFGEDITAEWGERDRRGRGRGRGRHHHEGGEHGEQHRGRGRRGPRSERFGGRAPFSPALVEALRGVRREAAGDDRDRRRGPGGAGMTAGRLLLAITRSGDPVVEAVLGWANDATALRNAIEEHAAQATA